MPSKKEKPPRVFSTFSRGLNFLRSQNYTTGKQEASYIFGFVFYPENDVALMYNNATFDLKQVVFSKWGLR